MTGGCGDKQKMIRIDYSKEFQVPDVGYAYFWSKKKEVINICDCKKLGFVGDVEFNPENGCITHLIVPGPGCLCGIFGREKEYIIPFQDVCQIGDDIILVQIQEEKCFRKEHLT